MVGTATLHDTFSRFVSGLLVRPSRPDVIAKTPEKKQAETVRFSIHRQAGQHVGVLHVGGALSSRNYLQLIQKAKELHHGGVSRLVIELEAGQPIGLSAQYALHAIVCISQGQDYPDHALGIPALRRMCEANLDGEGQSAVRLVCVDDVSTTGLGELFSIYPDVGKAMAAA